MARGSITKRLRKATHKPFYEARVVVGTYSGTNRPKEASKSFDTKREAQQWLNTRIAAIEQGIAVPRTKQTVADLLNYWMEHYVAHNVTPVTRESYTYTLKHLLASPLAGVLAQELKPEQVQRWYTAKRKAGCGERTLQTCHQRLAQAFKFGMKQGMVNRNPLQAVEPPAPRRKSMAIWTIPQIQTFLAVASKSSYGPVYMAILHTSLRRGEVLGLRWCDVDLDRATITVNQTIGLVKSRRQINPTPKNKSSNRTIAIDAELVAALRAHKANRPVPQIDGSDFVFHTQTGTAIYPRNLMRDFTRLLDEAGLPRLTLHGLRHTSISQALILGASLTAVSLRAGHSKVSTTTNIYAHVGWEQHQEVADRLGAAFKVKTTG
ncbi:MAG TPA: tyrosine-type recombinase/integrase [Chloroflexota bacterium]|nr:tyrosine-type recombinase/integrase [Chloroflexota bacterium]